MLHELEMSRYSLLNRPQSPTKGDTNVAFLDGNDEDEGYTLEERDIQKLFYPRHLTVVLVPGILLRYKNNYVPDYVPTPLQNDIHYKTDTLATDGHEFGPPSPELDAAWSDMLQYSNIRLSKNELSDGYHENPALAELSDVSGIYGSIAVFHSVHCIKRLRYLLYTDHYHANATEREMFELKRHGEHCLSYLLQSAKCNADLTVFPMQWGEKTCIPFGIDQSYHQCKDWDQIQDWARERGFDIYEPGLLVHPDYGWAYSDGLNWVTGVSVGDKLLADKVDDGH
ncbi:oxidase ustYa family protein [Aspergillus ruber CBS 135680]|uniref:Uncharacterized protein n=1 Tax=Aspergillus ruber (strain CBS 135680) TaxID=1388766 RepID=A0A017SJM3_ASPRC|nr:uncharacterized protein EURHEDRAFT_513707 [Aspergillus ruber CBS 135680]EYE97107.1 hypothetical protein EURHEDRAFT_513707 [Aspergillus ruber CBS 135680]